MKTDVEIQKDVLTELKWEPILKAAEIGVAVKDGVVTLSGIVDTYSEKLAAERAVKRIAGVKAVAEDLQVGVSPLYHKSDTEVAESVVQALQLHSIASAANIKPKVEDGLVTLEGEVEWNYQRDSIENALQGLAGVREIYNFIKIKPKALVPKDIKEKISAAFHRSATIDSQKVNVEIDGSTVILSGTVDSLSERDDAYYAAWAAPGVTSVTNNIRVAEVEYAF